MILKARIILKSIIKIVNCRIHIHGKCSTLLVFSSLSSFIYRSIISHSLSAHSWTTFTPLEKTSHSAFGSCLGMPLLKCHFHLWYGWCTDINCTRKVFHWLTAISGIMSDVEYNYWRNSEEVKVLSKWECRLEPEMNQHSKTVTKAKLEAQLNISPHRATVRSDRWNEKCNPALKEVTYMHPTP